MRRIALSVDWRDEAASIPADEVSYILVGQVVSARYELGRDALVLTYADGRTVRVALLQCKVHTCDDTYMLLQED